MSHLREAAERLGRTVLGNPKRAILTGLIAVILLGYWFVPIPGQVIYDPAHLTQGNAWPQMHLDPPVPAPGTLATIAVTDTTPWIYVTLDVDGRPATLQSYEANTTGRFWTWHFSFTVPVHSGYELVFYHDCNTGCLERARMAIGEAALPSVGPATTTHAIKLGVVFANPARDWHGWNGWDVELTYAQRLDQEYWGVSDLAQRVNQAAIKGLRVLVRVDYEQGQALPPLNDNLALDTYLQALRRLSRDNRLKAVFGYVIGSGYNTKGANTLAPAMLVTPEWYARVFNGYGVDPRQGDNVIETVHAENPDTRVLVGPVTPWNLDQDGRLPYRTNVPWLNYMNTLVTAINQSVIDKIAGGISLASPDGFAVQAPGRPDAPELGTALPADEPHINLPRSSWNGAEAGFRVYQEWLDIINAYPSTRGLPVYITSTNTFQSDKGVPPAQNYPRGWLISALDVINQEPQVKALCWFIDAFPMDNKWDLFSLTNPHALMLGAADDFEQALSRAP